MVFDGVAVVMVLAIKRIAPGVHPVWERSPEGGNWTYKNLQMADWSCRIYYGPEFSKKQGGGLLDWRSGI
ncbi:hypothetical protein hamaS1_22080 [Moorella sp. Hama-1]|nr:hypothetical protein hamaS1_22080 [Moorella sp. Hama-1]